MKIVFSGSQEEYKQVFQDPQGQAYLLQEILRQAEQRRGAQAQTPIDPIDQILATLPPALPAAPHLPALPASQLPAISIPAQTISAAPAAAAAGWNFSANPQSIASQVPATVRPAVSAEADPIASLLTAMQTTQQYPAQYPIQKRGGLFWAIALLRWGWTRLPWLLLVALMIWLGAQAALDPTRTAQFFRLGSLADPTEDAIEPAASPASSPAAAPTPAPSPVQPASVGHPPSIIEKLDRQLRGPVVN